METNDLPMPSKVVRVKAMIDEHLRAAGLDTRLVASVVSQKNLTRGTIRFILKAPPNGRGATPEL